MDLDSSKNQKLKLVDQVIKLNTIILTNQENCKEDIVKHQIIVEQLESKIIILQNALDSLKESKKSNSNSKIAYLVGLRLASIDSNDLAIDELLGVVKKYKGTEEGEISQFILGRQYMDKREFKKAIIELEDVFSNDLFISSLSIGLQGDCHSEMKDYKMAIKKYTEAAFIHEDDEYTPMYLFKASLCAEKEKDFEKALEFYSKIRDNYPKFAKVKNIDNYIDRVLDYK